MSPKMNLIEPTIELFLDDAEQRVVLEIHQVMFHKDVSVTDEISLLNIFFSCLNLGYQKMSMI